MLPLLPILGKIAGVAITAGYGKLMYENKKNEFKKKNPDTDYNAIQFLDDLKEEGQKRMDRLEKEYRSKQKS